ncbi:DUF2380 domain-containing protein [Myxococcota bacterium]|nr:DUF2380 domain-containing protein [Myxococcota bacterium]
MPRSLTLLLLAICLLLAPGLAAASVRSAPHVATTCDTEVEAQHPDDPDGRVLARLQSPAADTRPLLQELYIYAGGQLLGFLDFSSGWSNGRPFRVHTDLQGSLRLVTDASGEAMQELRWSPMGTLLSTSAPMLQDALAFAWQPLAYRGVPVVDVGARVRHAEYGWFLSPDPVAWGDPSDPQTFHRSQYARGNPMTYVDPWGENPVVVWAVVEGALTLADVGATAHTAYGVVAGTETVGALALEVGGTAAGALLPGGGYGAGVKGGREVAELAVKQGLLVRLRGFTQRNFRENLGRLTGGPVGGADAHHALPQAQEFAKEFQRLGINVHDPRLGAWWLRGDHGKKAWEYNKKWEEFFRDVANPSKDDVFDHARKLAEEYGFDVHF